MEEGLVAVLEAGLNEILTVFSITITIIFTFLILALIFPVLPADSLALILLKRKNISNEANDGLNFRILTRDLDSIMDKIFLVFLLKQLIIIFQEFIELLDIF